MLARPPRILHLIGVVAVSAAFFGGLALLTGAKDGFRYLTPINAGSKFADPRELLPGQHLRSGDGYDGQFTFYIAEDLLLRQPYTTHSLDNSLRYRRILYPLLAWAGSLGDPLRIPAALVGINVLAATLTVWILAVAARRAGTNPWLTLLVTINVGTWLPLLGDLTEPLQCALLAAGFLTDSALLLFLSGLAKETTAVTMLTQALAHARSGHFGRAARYVVALALTAVWALAVSHVVQARESTLGGHFLDPIGAPFIQIVQTWAGGPARGILLVPAVATAVIGVVRVAWHRDPASVAAAAYLLVALAAGNDTWVDPEAYFRVMIGGIVVLFLSWIVARDRLGMAALLLGAAEGALVLPALL